MNKKKQEMPFRYHLNDKLLNVISPYIFGFFVVSGFSWLITPNHKNPTNIAIYSGMAYLFYVTFVFFVGANFNVSKITIEKMFFLESFGGFFMGFLFVFGGGAMYLWLLNLKVAIIITCIYFIPCLIMAYMKYKERGLEDLLFSARKDGRLRLHEYTFSIECLPQKMSNKLGFSLYFFLIFSSIAMGAVATFFSRSDWKYSVASPLIGASSLSMLYLMSYGNLISMFYWIKYKRKKYNYEEFANWPREQFVDRS